MCVCVCAGRLGAVEGERVRLEEELEGARREVARQGSLTREVGAAYSMGVLHSQGAVLHADEMYNFIRLPS